MKIIFNSPSIWLRVWLKYCGLLIFSVGVPYSFSEIVKEKESKQPSAQMPAQTAKAISTEKSLYDEIVHVLKDQYVDPTLLNTKLLNPAAIQSVLAPLGTSVRLIEPENTQPQDIAIKKPAINSVSLLDPAIGYLRLERLDEDIVSQFSKEINKMIKEGCVQSFILDLRFAQGLNYQLIAPIASLFLTESKPLFNIQRGSKSQNFLANPPAAPNRFPLVVLINNSTKQAAEILSAVLQEQGRAILLGRSATAGQVYEATDVKLSGGQILRFATGKIGLALKGDLFLKNIEPDVTINFDEKLEKEIFEKPFAPPLLHLEPRYYSEAILTGKSLVPPINKEKNKSQPPESPSNKDLVLLKAIDLLKSIQTLGLFSPEKTPDHS